MKPNDTSFAGKSEALLSFLRDMAAIRRTRVTSYGHTDTVLWIADLPNGNQDCRSPFLSHSADHGNDVWLEVRKTVMPKRPAVPPDLVDWVRPDDLDRVDTEPELLPQIEVLVDRHVPDPAAPEDPSRAIVEKVPEVRRLSECREVEDAWINYLVEEWEPWAEKRRQWEQAKTVYENLDFMRRRLEEAQERYELVLSFGLLKWRDPTGRAIERHLLTAPAEITFIAANGRLTVEPAATFEKFRVELDMLEPQHRPKLDNSEINDLLEELDIRASEVELVRPILDAIANSLTADSQVDLSLDHTGRIEERPKVLFAPAIVLRERRPTAYDDLIGKLHEAATSHELSSTHPWNRLLSEGEPPENDRAFVLDTGDDAIARAFDDGRLLFPRPTNEEQRRIVERLRSDPCVVVKGPPGTGKSHTIANLICHLLAHGDRVLVTAHTAKALAVLRSLLPDDIRALCVTTLGFSLEDRRLLEESVRGILDRKSDWPGLEVARQKIEEVEDLLRELEDKLARIERDLRTFREAETYTHDLPGGYSGTAAQIAQRLSERQSDFEWFPKVSADAEFPLSQSEVQFLAEAHGRFTTETSAPLKRDLGVAELPEPNVFETLVTRLKDAETAAKAASAGVDEAKLAQLKATPTNIFEDLREAIHAFAEIALRADRVFGPISGNVLKDLLASAEVVWRRRLEESEALVQEARRFRKATGERRVEFDDGIPEDQLRADTKRRLEHLEWGGWQGFGFFAPRVMRETRYVVDSCRVDGRKVEKIDQLRVVVNHLELRRVVRSLQTLWGASVITDLSPQQAVARAEDLTEVLKSVLSFFQCQHAEVLAKVLGPGRVELFSTGSPNTWLAAVDAVQSLRTAQQLQHEFDQLLHTVRAENLTPTAHPCLSQLASAAAARDVEQWRAAWLERERLRQEQVRLEHYESLIKRLGAACPSLPDLLRQTAGDCNWSRRVERLKEAWEWAAAREWLESRRDTSALEKQIQEYHRTRRTIENYTEQFVSLRAWKAFFDRLDDATTQNLQAWMKATQRVGKGTGKYAHQHRRTAQRYLMACVPSIPAWVMPLYKLWDSVDAVPGLFDTVIVDEASQAGIEALVLLLLAKRIVIVGDDMQNSPEAVGVPEDDIRSLTRRHLKNFRFADEFRPDASLFDHAQRTFTNDISLREHFRCVPEIIRFSNDLCYRDVPLIPLRQPPPERLPALRSHFVEAGACEGEGSSIRNRAEAEAIVETIVRVMHDKAYQKKSMGVIALQGRAQAQLIERLLRERLTPKELEERHLRCGEPATFQGDERDVIFLSLVIAPNVNFRALTQLSDMRRFNVAMSRARDQVWLFHSVEAAELSPEDLRYRLIKFFENPEEIDPHFEHLEELESAVRSRRLRGAQPEPYESWFEVDVAIELLRRRYRVRPQVEVAGYRIDLVVEGLDARLAVECDGDEWHGPDRYETDMARQRQLERAGWTFVRVRGSDFYADRQRSIDMVIEACNKLKIKPLDFVPEKQSAPKSAPEAERRSTVATLEEPVSESEEEEDSAADTEVVSATADGPFTGYSDASGFPDPRKAPTSSLRQILHQIIEQNGPLTRSSIYRLYVEGCPEVERVGTTVRRALNRALWPMLQAGEVVEEDELGDGSPEGRVLHLSMSPPVKVRPAGRRDLLEIPPSELITVLRLNGSVPSTTGDVFEATCRVLLEHYGFKRLTKARKEYLRKVIERELGA
jgi:very-short-patch-repair endonuclease